MYGGAKNYSPPGTGQNNPNANYSANLPSTFNVAESTLAASGQQIFRRYDTNNCGKVPIYMLARMLEEFAYLNNTQPPRPADMEHYMQVFDMDGDSQLALWEWMQGLRSLAGYQVNPKSVAQNPQVTKQETVTQPIIVRENTNYVSPGLGMGVAGLGGLGLGLALASGPRYHRPWWGGWGFGPHHHMGWGGGGCHRHF